MIGWAKLDEVPQRSVMSGTNSYKNLPLDPVDKSILSI